MYFNVERRNIPGQAPLMIKAYLYYLQNMYPLSIYIYNEGWRALLHGLLYGLFHFYIRLSIIQIKAEPHSIMADFWAGYLSGIVGIVIGSPLDIVKTRSQSQVSTNAHSWYQSPSSLLRGLAFLLPHAQD